jgi:lipoic acid synthetase
MKDRPTEAHAAPPASSRAAPAAGGTEPPEGTPPPLRKPEWLKVRLRCGDDLADVHEILSRYSLNTVCTEANCPNRMECYSRRTATFMVLGAVCTRNCAFCNVTPGPPEQVDSDEPRRILEAVRELGLRYVVITSVTRDDLPDGGAGHFARVIETLKSGSPGTLVEVLIPDFKGNPEALRRVLEAGPDVLNHNVETVPRLYPAVRPQAEYLRSLEVIRRAKTFAGKAGPGAGKAAAGGPSMPRARELKTKSGIMVGLGETPEEVRRVLRDLRTAGCDLLTIGQYLAPSKKHHPVIEYVHPDVFAEYRRYALETGFRGVAAAPFVRSSYNAADMAGCMEKETIDE